MTNMEAGLVLGDWRFERLLTGGTFARVAVMLNFKTDERCALKMCNWPENVVQPKLRAQWTREVQEMNDADHLNIIKTLAVPEYLSTAAVPYNISKLPMLWTEYCSGGDLRQTLSRPDNINGLPEPEVRCILSDLKDAISYLHSKKITHRDIKPENIVLQPTDEPKYGRSFTYKLTDLGIAKNVSSETLCESFTGTLQYFAPELFYSKSHSHTVDYWSLGLIAFEVVCGTRPFLPNMAPVQWMSHLKTKTAEQICAYETLKDEIVFSEEIFKENNISTRFKALMEKWLRIPLEWDPKKRGNEKTVTFSLPGKELPTAEGGPPQDIFSALNAVLAKKIITVFSLPTYVYLSYEIDDNTTFTSLQTWIERDAKVNINDQLFISGVNFHDVNVDDAASYYWSDKVPIMLFLYDKGNALLRNTKPRFSPDVLPHMENPKMSVKYHYYLRVLACTFHFVSVERQLYESFVSGTINRLEYLKKVIDCICISHQKTDRDISILTEKSKILNDALNGDEEKIKKHKGQFADIESWVTKTKPLLGDVSKMKDAWNQFTIRLGSVNRRLNEIKEKEIYSEQNNPEFKELHESAYALIKNAYATPKSDRVHPKSCYDATKILYKCFKLRDKLLLNVDSQKLCQKVSDIHTETNKMNSLISIVAKSAQSLSKDVSNAIVERQDAFWRALEHVGTSTTVAVAPKSLTDFKIGEPVRSKVSIEDDHRLMELQLLINESNTLKQNSLIVIRQIDNLQKAMKDDASEEMRILKLE